ncbi:MAG: MotA/TolQ/ExbB proton channel family protein, partial [Polyangia bacterium]
RDYDVVDGAVRAMERTKDRELANLRRGLPVLATVSSSAPFVGLFGTVGGIITAFQKLADPAKGGGGIGTVSAGIAEALVTTAVGLGVAIIAVWFYNYFTARVDDLIVDMDETASELVDSIIKDTRVGVGGGATQHAAARP